MLKAVIQRPSGPSKGCILRKLATTAVQLKRDPTALHTPKIPTSTVPRPSPQPHLIQTTRFSSLQSQPPAPVASQDIRVCTESITGFVDQVKSLVQRKINTFPLISAAFDGEYPSETPISAEERQPTYLLLLQILLHRGQLEAALKMHRHLLIQGFVPPLQAYALLFKYLCSDRKGLPNPDFVEPIWSRLWNGPSRIIHLDVHIFHAMLCTLFKLKQFSVIDKELESYIQEQRRKDLILPNYLYALAIRAACADGDMDTAHKWFDAYRASRYERPAAPEQSTPKYFPHHTDASVYTTFMAGYARASPTDLSPILAISAQMSEDRVPFTLEAYNQLISGSRRHGDVRGAFELYNQLQNTRAEADDALAAIFVPDSYTFGSLFKALEAWRTGNVQEDQRPEQYTPPVTMRELFRHLTEAQRSSSVPVMHPDMLSVALRCFLRDRDYAAALVVLHTVERYPRGKGVYHSRIRDTVLDAFSRRIAGELKLPPPLEVAHQPQADIGPRSEADDVRLESQEALALYNRDKADAFRARQEEIEARSRWTRLMFGDGFSGLVKTRPHKVDRQQSRREALIHLGEQEQAEYPLVKNVWGLKRPEERHQYTPQDYESSIHPFDECPVAPDFPPLSEDGAPDSAFHSVLHADSLLPAYSANGGASSLGDLPAALRSLGMPSPVAISTLIALTQRALVSELGFVREPDSWGRGQQSLHVEVKKAAKEMLVRRWESDHGVKLGRRGVPVDEPAVAEASGVEVGPKDGVPGAAKLAKDYGTGINAARRAARMKRRVNLGYLPRYSVLEESAIIEF